jgi:hypothetical protein
MDIELPKWAVFATDNMDTEKWILPAALREEPSLTTLLVESAEPRFTKSRAERDFPIFRVERTEMVEPRLV